MLNKEVYTKLTNELTGKASLIAVSKLKPATDVQGYYDLGQRDFGENYAQELKEKAPELPQDIRWHFIGHLQRNKVKYIAPFVYMIQSVDSFKLFKEIDKEAKKNNRIINCLLQVHVTDEVTKTGMDSKDLVEFMSFYDAQKVELQHVKIRGIMGMSTLTDDQELIRNDFKKIASLFQFLKESYFPVSDDFKEISMGMSGDYEIALEEGSTMIRVGSKLFGARPPKS